MRGGVMDCTADAVPASPSSSSMHVILKGGENE